MEFVNNMMRMFDEVTETYRQNQLLIKQIEDEHNDLIHETAHGVFRDMASAYEIYLREREILVERHRLQDENMKTRELYDWCMANQRIRTDCKKMLSSYNLTVRRIESRAYTPRVRNDLTMKQTKRDTETPMYRAMDAIALEASDQAGKDL